MVVSTQRKRERGFKSSGRTEKEKRALYVKRSEGRECSMFESETERESAKQQEVRLGL